MLIRETSESGVFTVRRRADEKPFALLKAPRARVPVRGPVRTWGIYSSDGTECCNSAETRALAERDLTDTIRACSAWQLGLIGGEWDKRYQSLPTGTGANLKRWH